MTVATARKHRLRVNEETAEQQLRAVASYIDSWRERVLQGDPAAFPRADLPRAPVAATHAGRRQLLEDGRAEGADDDLGDGPAVGQAGP